MNKAVENALINNFINPLDKGCLVNLTKLTKEKVKHVETISLLQQSYNTLKNSCHFLEKYEFIDSNSLLRSTIEYLAMAMLIEENDNVYNEFIDLYPEERKYTAPMKLLGMFGGKLKKYSSILFNDTNRKERELLMLDLYDTLCSYTHGSLLINLFAHVQKKEDNEVLKMLSYLNFYFVKLMLYACLKYINKNNDEYLDTGYIVVSFLFYINEINIYIKENNLNFKKYNKYLHLEDNNMTYLDVHKDKLFDMLNEFNDFAMNDKEKEMFEQICKQFFEIN